MRGRALVWVLVLGLSASIGAFPAAASAAGSGPAHGPTGGPDASVAVRGLVHRIGAPDPIPGARIRATGGAGAAADAVADGRGAYRMGLAPGRWSLAACADGYGCVTRTVVLKAGRPRRLDLALAPEPIQGLAVTILGHREAPQPVEASVSRAEIKEIPGTFGDALRAVQILPGVAAPSDISGQLLIQGGGPNDNLYWVDSVPWPIPFHFGGLDSTVDPELLSSVDLYGAGYGSRWGGVLAAVLDGRTQAPPSDRLHVEADLSLLEASASLAGPLGLGNATFALTARRSYFDLVGRLVGQSDLPVYDDSQAVVDFHLGANNRFHILAMGSDDVFNAVLGGSGGVQVKSGGAPVSGSLMYGNAFESGGLGWTNTSIRGLVSTLTPYVYHTAQDLGITPLADDNARTTFGLKEEAVYSAGSWLGLRHEVSAGGDAEWTAYSFSGMLPRVTNTAQDSFADLTSLPQVASNVSTRGWDGYAYIQDRARLDRFWALTLGLHYDTSTLVADGEVGPRAALEFKPTPRDTWTAAWGLYDQAPLPLQVNPQYGNPGLEPESAQHAVLSYEHDFLDSVILKGDAYYKALTDLVVAVPSNPAIYANAGQGDVKGMDLSLSQDLGALFWTLSGSLSQSDRLDLAGEPWSLYQYDQPQILNAVVSWMPVPRWTLGAKLRYNSGDLVLPAGATWYTPADRLPYYLRVDLRVERAWTFPYWSLKAYFEILNVLNRQNGEAATSSSGQSQQVPDLPRLPNLGLEVDY